MDGGTADFIDIYVSSDNTNLGTIVSEQMVKAIGEKGNIVEIINDAGSMIRIRRDAMHAVIAKYPDIKVTNSMVYAWPDFYPDIKSKMESFLQANPNPGDIAAVFSTFDGAGIAAAAAIREAGRQDKIVVVGIDGDPDAYAEMRIPGSPFIATMAQDPDTIARETVRRVVALLNGETFTDKVMYIPGILITKDNIPPAE
jgi:ribose transport system substrate-binding protein